MAKNIYLNTALLSLLAFVLLLLVIFTWPFIEYSLHDVLLGSIKLSAIEKEHLIQLVRVNYALDTLFIFAWIGSWVGLFLHFKSLNSKLIRICFGLSLLGALLDITENTISFSLLIGTLKSVENWVFVHTIISDVSYWLPMIASFMLVLILPKQKNTAKMLLKFTGSVGVLFAILGMYISFFAVIPDYWFGLWAFATAVFLFDYYKKVTY